MKIILIFPLISISCGLALKILKITGYVTSRTIIVRRYVICRAICKQAVRGSIMICPQCGYERQKKDNIVSLAECPKCGIMYNKWKNDEPHKDEHGEVTETAYSSFPSENKKKMSLEKLAIYAVVVAVSVIILHSFIVPAMISLYKCAKTVRPSSAAVDGEKSDDHVVPADDEATGKALPQKIAAVATSSVVVINTHTGAAAGGFFLNRNGDIITSGHFLTTGDDAEIKTSDGSYFNVTKVLARNVHNDLVIASTSAPPHYARPLEINTSLPQPGEKVFIPDWHKGDGKTVASGNVLAVLKTGPGAAFIQVNVPILASTSGAPLLNRRGEVIGVAVFKNSDGTNINQCIASEEIIALDEIRKSFSFNPQTQMPSPKTRDVYCYVGSDGHVSFVEWQTRMQLTRPDGSLDAEKFEKWVLEEIGIHPDYINPEKEALEDLEKNREMLFKSVFPHRSMSDTNLTTGEKEWLEARYRKHYWEVYNHWATKREDAIRKYNTMMADFKKFRAQRK